MNGIYNFKGFDFIWLNGKINVESIMYGDRFFVSHDEGKIKFLGNMKVLVCRP